MQVLDPNVPEFPPPPSLPCSQTIPEFSVFHNCFPPSPPSCLLRCGRAGMSENPFFKGDFFPPFTLAVVLRRLPSFSCSPVLRGRCRHSLFRIATTRRTFGRLGPVRLGHPFFFFLCHPDRAPLGSYRSAFTIPYLPFSPLIAMQASCAPAFLLRFLDLFFVL